MKKRFLEAGRVSRPHALKGEAKFEHWGDDVHSLSGVKFLYRGPEGQEPLEILSRRAQGDRLLLSFKGFLSPEDVLPLKGKTLYVDRNDLDPEGKLVFIADLIGLRLIEEETGEDYGEIVEVTNRGGGDLYLIKRPDGREEYFPAVKEFVRRVDTDKAVFVKAPEGLFGSQMQECRIENAECRITEKDSKTNFSNSSEISIV